MGTVIKSQKTELYWASGPAAVTRATSITNINGLASPREAIENTDLDATTDKTYFAGLGAPGAVTVAVNVRKGELAHRALIDLRDSGAVVSWGIYSSGADTVPTAVGGVLQAASGRVSARFMGFVSDVSVDVQGNSIWKGTITIQRSGKVSYDLQTPDEEIAAMFAAGEQGAWYDPSDWSTLFQDAAGTTPVTALEQPVGRMLDKSGRGNHASQATAGSRPVLSARVNELTESEFRNGVTDAAIRAGLVTAASLPGYAGALAFGRDGTTTSFALKSTAASVAGRSYTFSCVVQMDDGGAPVFLGNNGDGTVVDFAIAIANTAVAPSSYQVVNLGSGQYRVSATLVAAQAFSGVGVYKYATNSARTFKITAYHYESRSYAPSSVMRYQRITTATEYDSAGFPQFLKFDGATSSMSTGLANFTSTNKVTVTAGVCKLSDAGGAGVVAELSLNYSANAGAFGLFAPTSATPTIAFASNGSAVAVSQPAGFPAPLTAVLTGIGDISAPLAQIRANGVAAGAVTTTQGAGNYGNYPLYIGRRGGTSLAFSGNLYSLCILGRLATATELAALETRAALRAGVTL